MITLSLTDEIREALIASDKPAVQIAEESGIHPVTLSRFRTGARDGLSADNLEKLANALGLQISIKPAKKRK